MSRVKTQVDQGRLMELCGELGKPGGGFSVRLLTNEDVRSGFVLSIHPDREQQISGRVYPEDVKAFALKNADLLARDGAVMGGWRDGESGLAYLDVSVVVNDRVEAFRLAREHGQLAIFDVAAGTDVRVS